MRFLLPYYCDVNEEISQPHIPEKMMYLFIFLWMYMLRPSIIYHSLFMYHFILLHYRLWASTSCKYNTHIYVYDELLITTNTLFGLQSVINKHLNSAFQYSESNTHENVLLIPNCKFWGTENDLLLANVFLILYIKHDTRWEKKYYQNTSSVP